VGVVEVGVDVEVLNKFYDGGLTIRRKLRDKLDFDLLHEADN
jgi:hypothetical protein